jgi:hypothetical protein
LKPNKVASLPEVAPVPLLLVPLPEALALCMKKEFNYVSKVTKICSKEKQRSYVLLGLIVSLS